MMQLAEKLANFVTYLEYETLPTSVTQQAKRCVLDLVGAAIAGSDAPWSNIVLDFVRQQGGAESSIIAHSFKALSMFAALANGVMAHSYELDDAGEQGGHPGAVVVPTALAIGEKVKASGKEFIASIVAGYEINGALIGAADPHPERPHYARGFHPTATCGTFSSAAVAAKLLRLDKTLIANCLGVAGSFASGSLQFLMDGAMTKRLHPGMAAHNGIMCALLAGKGFTGPTSIFEGKYGFFKAYSGLTQIKDVFPELKTFHEIMSVSFKRHACCLASHSSIDATLGLAQEYLIKPEDIDEIIVKIRTSHLRLVAEPIELKYSPQTMLDAQMSLPYTLAAALLYERATMDEFGENKIHERRILSLAKKVKPVIYPEYDKEEWSDKRPATVEIRVKDGRKYSREVEFPKGSPRNPFTTEELEEKFSTLAGPVLGEEKVKKTIDVIQKLDAVEDISHLTRLLTP